MSSCFAVLPFTLQGFPGVSDSKESACNAGDLGADLLVGKIPWRREWLGEGSGYPLQYSCLENSMDKGAWQAKVHGVAMTE